MPIVIRTILGDVEVRTVPGVDTIFSAPRSDAVRLIEEELLETIGPYGFPIGEGPLEEDLQSVVVSGSWKAIFGVTGAEIVGERVDIDPDVFPAGVIP